jgi:hypothetical protein
MLLSLIFSIPSRTRNTHLNHRSVPLVQLEHELHAIFVVSKSCVCIQYGYLILSYDVQLL